MIDSGGERCCRSAHAEHLVSQRTHRVLTQRTDHAEGDVEVLDLDGEPLGGSQVGERTVGSHDRIVFLGGSEVDSTDLATAANWWA